MPVIVEINDIFDKISQHFQNQSDSVLNNTPPPSTDLVMGITFPDSLSFVYENVDSPSTYALGASQEAVFTAASALREIDMAIQPKSNVYLSYANEQAEESAYYKSSGAFYSGVASGNPTTGSRS